MSNDEETETNEKTAKSDAPDAGEAKSDEGEAKSEKSESKSDEGKAKSEKAESEKSESKSEAKSVKKGEDEAKAKTKDEAKSAKSKDGGASKSKDDGEGRSGTMLGTALFAVLFVATLVGGYVLGQKIQEWRRGPVEVEDETRYKVSLRGDEPQRGPDDALVTIIEFSDFQCPYCVKAAGPLDQAVDSWGDDVRLIYKHYPLPGHVNALPAAKTAWAAHQQGKFWEFHDWLFESEGKIDDLPKMVEEHGLDGDKLGADMESDGAATAVDDDRLAGGRVGISGTPAFVVNGHIYKGARGRADWNQIIKFELAHAREIEAAGVPRAEVYAKLMEDAETDRGPKGDGTSKVAGRERRAGEPFADQHYRVPTGIDRPQIGPDDALVTIVEFADFDCPFCVRVSPTIKGITKKYGDDVRLVFRQHPLGIHPHADEAAQAAVAAHKQGKFWEMHDALYADKMSKTKEDYVRLAEKVGLDTEKFAADYDDPATKQWIALDQATARHYNANGTPAFFINGRYLSGAQPPSAFEKVIDEELAAAKERVASGTPRAQLYDAILKDAQPEVVEPGKAPSGKAPPASVPMPESPEPDPGAASANVEDASGGAETDAEDAPAAASGDTDG